MAARKPKKRKTAKEKAEEEARKAAEEKTRKAAAERFVEDLLIRGEAAYPDAHGNLPPGATHEIVDEPGDGKPPKVRRRRFSVL